MSKWLNTSKVVAPGKEKPCHELGFCPYGQLVEEFPLRGVRDRFSCKTFGHDCPVFYHAEDITE